MLFLLLGLLFLALKYLEIGFMANIGWWWAALPFGLAFFYWEVLAPYLGISKKRAARQMEARKQARIDKLREANHPHLRKGRRR